MEPYGITIFCDDIREELNGKISLIGCYGPDLQFFGNAPVVLPKLAFHIIVRLPCDKPIPPLKLIVFFPGDKDEQPTMLVELPVPENLKQEPESGLEPNVLIPDGMRTYILRQHFILSPVQITQEGFIRVRLMYGDDKIRLGVLKVQQAPVPSPN